MGLRELRQAAAALIAPPAPAAPVIPLRRPPQIGNWTLPINPAQANAGGPMLAGAQLAAEPINLYGQAPPSVMEEWQLNTINIPLAVAATSAGSLASNAITVAARILYGGDPVWSASAYTIAGRNLQLTGIMDPPVPIRRGRALTLQLLASPAESVETLTLYIAQELNSGTPQPLQGSLGYQTIELTGRRVL